MTRLVMEDTSSDNCASRNNCQGVYDTCTAEGGRVTTIDQLKSWMSWRCKIDCSDSWFNNHDEGKIVFGVTTEDNDPEKFTGKLTYYGDKASLDGETYQMCCQWAKYPRYFVCSSAATGPTMSTTLTTTTMATTGLIISIYFRF